MFRLDFLVASSLLFALLCIPVDATNNADDSIERKKIHNEDLEDEHRGVKVSSSVTSPLARNSRYRTLWDDNEESLRRPDRHSYAVSIVDIPYGRSYAVAVGGEEEILAFKEGHGFASSFVHNDDVYYLASPEQKPVRVSSGGMIHGLFDWVYNEEIFGRERIREGAMWFSPSDKYLAYASRPVNSSKEFMITTYERANAYDYHYNMEYPKPGEKRIAVFNISIWSAETNNSITMDVQLRERHAFHYLFGVSWVVLHGKEVLLTTWANRWQNETSMTICDYEKAACSLIYEHKYDHGQWASPEDYERIVHSNDSFFVLLPQSMRGNAWQHVARIETTADYKLSSISFVTSGEYDISRIVGYRHNENIIVYEAQAPHPWNRQIYGAPAEEKSVLSQDQCLTCVLTNCTYQEETQISRGKLLEITVSCNGPSKPFGAVVSFNSSLYPTGIKIKSSSQYSSTPPEWKIETFKLSSGYEANVQINFGSSNLDSVPVLLFVYGGPNMNEVTDEYRKKYPKEEGHDPAVVRIDVRGSGGRGWNYRSAVYGRLVTVEVEDTVEAMKMVLDKYPRLDKKRVVVYGWSYGGAMSTALVERAPDGFFKCAIAGAPVTNFLYYDATYTERFMGDSPPANYTDLTVNVEKFEHTKFLLIHGLRDDNVHFQNSAFLIEALQEAIIQFELMVYPNEAHAIHNFHQSELVGNFLSRCYA